MRRAYDYWQDQPCSPELRTSKHYYANKGEPSMCRTTLTIRHFMTEFSDCQYYNARGKEMTYPE